MSSSSQSTADPLETRRRAGECSTCASDPTAAPGRWCAPRRCYCGHEACPAYALGWVARPTQLRALAADLSLADDDELDNPLARRVLAMAAKPGRTVLPERIAHTDRLRDEWDHRDGDEWPDRL